MAHRARCRRGGRGWEFIGNFGDGIENDCNSNENRDEIKELKVATLYDEVRHLQWPAKSMDWIPLENFFGAPLA